MRLSVFDPRVDEGNKCGTLLTMKTKACTVVRREGGGEDPPCDPADLSCKRRGYRANVIDWTEKKTNVLLALVPQWETAV